ncbi:MAG: hypothetical protein AAGF35_14195 [Pseudomonadota bacterium]
MTLLIILLVIFGGVALMAIVTKRFSGPNDERRAQQLQRWLVPLVGIMLALSLINYLW